MSGAVRAVQAGRKLGSGVRLANMPIASPGPRIDEDEIVRRLEHAGATLLALPSKGYTTHLRQMRFEIVHTALEAYGWDCALLRPPVPSAAAITEMDETFSWLMLIPETSHILRRILGARALVHPVTGRYIFPWRRLATTLGTDHKSVQRWHANGVSMLHKRLNDG